MALVIKSLAPLVNAAPLVQLLDSVSSPREKLLQSDYYKKRNENAPRGGLHHDDVDVSWTSLL
jgi:hypothetical protein